MVYNINQDAAMLYIIYLELDSTNIGGKKSETNHQGA